MLEDGTSSGIPAIDEVIQRLELQPVLFLGAGFSRRYFGGLNWVELLRQISAKAVIETPLDYFVQKHSGNLPLVASDLVEPVFEWAWRAGKNSFSKELFQADVPRDTFLKSLACDTIRESMEAAKIKMPSTLRKELDLLAQVFPQAVITTNYDTGLDQVFKGYKPIVGQEIYRYKLTEIGEVYKIHGSVDRPQSLILTSEDYQDYDRKRKYLAAKLLAMFAENPVIIAGYSLTDPNVTKLICDIGEITASDDGRIENIIYVDWRPPGEDQNAPDTLTLASGERTFYVRRVVVSDFLSTFQSSARQQRLPASGHRSYEPSRPE